MARKTSGQNPVDEAYLRSLMAGSPPEKVTPSIPPKEETDRETAEKAKTESEAEEMPEKAASKTLKAAQTEFMRRFLTPYKCEGRQGVYIDKELHRKISVIVGIAGKRQLTVGNYIDNVLREHFEKHSDEVKAYCQKSYNKIFKLWICDYVMKPERFCSGCCSPICSWTSSCSGDSLARYVSGRHAAAWRKPCGVRQAGSIR